MANRRVVRPATGRTTQPFTLWGERIMASQEELAIIDAGRRRQELAAEVQGEAYVIKGVDGHKEMQVDSVLFHRARIQNQVAHNIDNCWEDPDYRRDIRKRHPETRVKTLMRNASVGGGSVRPGRGVGRHIPGLGNVTFHKAYS